MKLALSAAILLSLLGAAAAEPRAPANMSRWKLADAAGDACTANCASQATACKRVCPTTFSVPCQTSCDSQAQSCQQGCQRK